MMKLVRAIFFQNTILTKDISIQVDIPIENNKSNNISNDSEIIHSCSSESFNDENNSIKQNIILKLYLKK